MNNIKELAPQELTLDINFDEIEGPQSPIEIPEIIGQPRAVEALKMGIQIRNKGYNIFVSGLSGTGRYTAIRRLLHSYCGNRHQLEDIILVYNFKMPEALKPLKLPAGSGYEFKKQMHAFIETAKVLIRSQLKGDYYKNKRDILVSAIEQSENQALSEFEAELQNNGFKIVHVEEDFEPTADIAPLIDGKAISFSELHSMVSRGELEEEQWKTIREKYYFFMDQMKELFYELQKTRRNMGEELQEIQKEIIRPEIKKEIDILSDNFNDKAIQDYLSEVKEDITDHLHLFFDDKEEKERKGTPALHRYAVNVLVNNSHLKNPPIIYENSPTSKNLFGNIDLYYAGERQGHTNFLMVKAGSMVQASGGFLIIQADDLLRNPELWHRVKRVLQTEHVEILNEDSHSHFPVPHIKPAKIPVQTKVILVGEEHLYDFLYNEDSDFYELFKICAEFDSVMPRTIQTTQLYTHFIRQYAQKNINHSITKDGLERLVLFGIKTAEDRQKLTTRFSMLEDVLTETKYWVERLEKSAIDSEVIDYALAKRKHIFNLPEEKIEEMVLQKEILIQLKGKSIGTVNGLAIYDRGFYSFGSPCVISAKVAPGDEGIVNIEREVGLSGEIHDKGIMILEGYLRDTYARDFPLSIYAGICFEQSYSEVDGDSATSTEVYALLSAIANVPVRLDIAVTGSVNQMGFVQPVGGITEKVEGFYTICKKTGLTGTQGVIIPKQNIRNLIVSRELIEAVERKEFHLYPIATIDEGLSLLTELPIGKRDRKGQFPHGTINEIIERRLMQMAEKVKHYGGN